MNGSLLATIWQDETSAERVTYYVNGQARELSIVDGHIHPDLGGKLATEHMRIHLYDHLGNTRATLSPKNVSVSGPNNYFLQHEVTALREFFPYGKVLREYTLEPDKFLTTQHESDLETGLDYRMARLYDEDLGVFLGVDPLEGQRSWVSPYNYVQNNPIMRLDPDGMLDDWVERKDENGDESIVWDENVTSEGDEDLKEGDTYLGKAVVVFEGSLNEKLGDDGTLHGSGARPAKVTVYGPKGSDDIKTYDGLTVSSDPKQYSMIEQGDYEGRWQQMATSPYGKGSLTYRIHNLDGSTRIKPNGGKNKNGKTYMEGIFFHRTNWSGKATHSSQGCLLVCGTQWKQLENQLGKLNSFRIRVTR